MVDGCRSELVKVLSGVPQDSVLDPALFHLFTLQLFSFQENKLISYANESTLIDVVPSPGVKVTVAESLISDLGWVSELYDLWELNWIKTKTMIISRSHTMHPVTPINYWQDLY